MIKAKSKLELALINRFVASIGQQVNPMEVDCEQSFFDPAGFFLGGHPFDSLALAELMLALEGDLDIELIDESNLRKIYCISAIAEAVRVRADPVRLSAFEQRWSGATELT